MKRNSKNRNIVDIVNTINIPRTDILPMVSATKTLDKVLCLACDVKHSSFENGQYNICNDTIEHVRITENGETLTYKSCPFKFNLPAQTETDNTQIIISNIGLISSNILRAADNSFEDIIIKCWLIVGNYDGTCSWLDFGEYVLDTTQTEDIEYIMGSLAMKNCYGINAGKFRGNNPSLFINLNHR